MRLKMLAAALLCAAMAGPALGAGENARVMPYAVPSPAFDSSQNAETTALSLGYVHTTVSVPNSAGLGLDGFDLGVGYRKALNDDMAWDAHLSLIPEFGGGGGTRLYTFQVPLQTNFEYQAVKRDNFNVIAFAGPNFGIASTNFTQSTEYVTGNSLVVNTPGNGIRTTGSTSWFYGIQFGAQAAYDAGPVKVVPFLMFSPDWASFQSKGFSVAQNNIVSTNGSVPGTFLTSFGSQLWFHNGLGMNLTYQTAPGEGSFGDFHSLMFGFNYAF